MAELRAALAAGADLRDPRGRRVRPLGPAPIRKLIDTLATVLDEAVEDGLLDRDPARGKRMRVRVPKPRRTFLEMDGRHATRDRVAVLAACGMRASGIAAELGLAKSTVTFHLGNLGLANAEPYTRRRAIVETLGRSGVRQSSSVTYACPMPGCTTPRARASGSPTRRPRPAPARSRSRPTAPTC